MQKQFPGGAVLEEGVLRMCCGFLGAYLRGCDFKKVEIALLHCGSPVSLLHICGTSFSESTSGGLLLDNDNYIYVF